MKIFVYNLLIIFLFVTNLNGQELYFSENFDESTIPEGWTQLKVSGAGLIEWRTNSGGYWDPPTEPNSGNPAYPYQGAKNALFQYASLDNEQTKLITPPIDISFGIKPEIRFWHAQADRYYFFADRHDELKVYCKVTKESSWILLEEYPNTVSDWTFRQIQVPDSLLSSTMYFAFEGKTDGGYGICIDSLTILETGIIPKYLESLVIKQASTDEVPTESNLNKILRIDFTVRGNDGAIKLDSLVISSLNTNDGDIKDSGVKLYASDDTLFYNSTLISAGNNFIAGKATFININKELKTGISSIWITYDIKEDIDHSMQGHILDAKILADNIKINNSYYPAVQKSPLGNRSIVESIFFDDFENDNEWVLTGEFERDIPLGLGGSIGESDPFIAYSGSYIIGTDLTGLGSIIGDYESNLTSKEYSATSPVINSKYFRDIKLSFWRWLNVDGFDSVSVDLGLDNQQSWNTVWKNDALIKDSRWTLYSYNISSIAFNEDSLNIKFSLGPTDGSGDFSGWNIDNIYLTGDFLTVDAGITEIHTPVTGCGHSDSEPVTVVINNYAGLATNDTIPVFLSFDGGTTRIADTIFTSLPVNGVDTIVLPKTIDLTEPGEYNLMVSTNLYGDEVAENNSFTHTFYAVPTYNLPYSENFESNNGHWRSLGLANWEYGKPTSGNINTAASGEYAWVTKLNANYPDNDSSFLESPCFDFTGINNPIFEFKLKGSSQEGDGMAIYYSIDNGAFWTIISETADYYWEWYNKSNIYALNTAGWDTISDSWYTVRKLLPSEIANEPNVKFYFLFKSSETLNNEGFGIDDIKIYDAPYDVGISNLKYPYTKCELSDTTHVKVYIKNYGLNDVKTDTKIPIKLNIDSDIVHDTISLTSDLIVGDTILFVFNSTVDMLIAKDYDFVINSDLESNTFFYNNTLSNDTIYKTISVTGMPDYDIGWIVGSDDLDTLLDAGAGYTTYSWYHGGSEVSTDQTYQATEGGLYYVTVTNGVGCSANDSLKVVSSVVNMTMDSVLTVLKDSCFRSNLTELQVQAVNNSIGGFSIGDSIYFGYQINDNPIVADTLILADTLTASPPGDTVLFAFKVKCDFKSVGEYNVKLFTNFDKDLDLSDDSLYFTFNTWGGPDVELEFDSIFSSQADTLTLDAGAGFGSYLWNVDSTTQTITPTKETGWYVVTVEDSHFCSADKDSTFIETYDLGINSVVSPVSDCEHTSNEVIQVSLHNYSGNTYATGTKIPFKYYFNNTWENDTVTLSSDFSPGVDKDLTFTKNIDLIVSGEYPLKIKLDSETDVNSANDSVEISLETWGYPEVTLAYDTILTSRADTVLLIAQSGFINYMWNDGTADDTLIVTKKYTKKYIVTADDFHGCISSKDSTQIIAYNLGISELNLPKSSCSHGAAELVKIIIKNYGQDTILSGEKIDAYYKFEDNVPEYVQITLSADLFPYGTITHQFTNTVDLSAVNTYILKAYINYENDVYRLNDTIIEGIRTYSNPSVQVGANILTTQPDTVIITASTGYNNYLWNDGSKNDSLIVSYLASKTYAVTVTDINGCTASDTMELYTYNVATSSLISPVSQCVASDAETVTIDVINNGPDTLLAGEIINVSYSINSGSAINGSINLSEDFYPDSIVEYTFSQKADLSDNIIYEFNVLSEYSVIDVDTDDALIANVDIYAPDVDLGSDTVRFTDSYEISTSESYVTYAWSTGEDSPTITVTTTGTYKVTVTTVEGCEGIGKIYCEKTTGVDNIIKGETFNITYYPNPVSENLKIEFANAKNSDITIEVVNVNGSIIYNRKLENILNSTENVDFTNYAKGIYFIRFKVEDKIFVREIIVQ